MNVLNLTVNTELVKVSSEDNWKNGIRAQQKTQKFTKHLQNYAYLQYLNKQNET